MDIAVFKLASGETVIAGVASIHKAHGVIGGYHVVDPTLIVHNGKVISPRNVLGCAWTRGVTRNLQFIKSMLVHDVFEEDEIDIKVLMEYRKYLERNKT